MKKTILQRQLSSNGLDESSLPTSLAAWQKFLSRIENAYESAEQERYLLERSLLISSKEMQERWQMIEAERSRAEQAGRMATLGEMAGGMAHEINNPVTVIQLLAAQARELMAEEPLEKALVLDHLQKIESTAVRIAKIVSGLRTFSRDGTEDPFVPYSLPELLEETIALCGERFRHDAIELRVDTCERSTTLECRPSQISQVLLNFLNNARDAIGELPEKWIHLAVSCRENEVEISITDAGAGIPAEIQQKIFQPFFTTKELGKGTGLGLSISKGIIDAHHGQISVDASSAHTRFVITLPRRQPS